MDIRILALAATALVLSACAPTRLLKPDSFADPASLGLEASIPGSFQMILHHVIVPGTAGTWVREANWFEYHLTLVNEGDQPVTVQAVELSSALPAIGVHTTSLATLDTTSLDNTRMMRSLGLAFGLPGGVTLAATTAASGFAGAAIAIIALPIVLIGGTVYVVQRSNQDAEDARLIQDELVRRGVRTPLALGPRSGVKASAFFPLTTGVRQLSVRFRRDGAEHELAMDLPAGMAGTEKGR